MGAFPHMITIARYRGARYSYHVTIFDQLATNRATREHLAEQQRQADEELRQLVKTAFEQGATAPELAKATGLSAPRMYQIRDGRR